jgi:predicted DNA-binding WGR domain protein
MLVPSRLPSQWPYRLVRNWGRIGTNGQALLHERTEIFATGSGKALEVMVRLKRREGFGISERAGSLAREGRPSEVPPVGVTGSAPRPPR